MLKKNTHIITGSCLNEESFSHLYKQYATQVFRAAKIYTNNDDLAKEIVQEVFLAIWNKKDIAQSPPNWLHFLLRCAKNKAIDQSRKEQRKAEYGKFIQHTRNASHSDTEQQVLHNDLSKKINELVQKLPRQCKEVYILSREKGLNHEQIASLLGIATKTVKNHLNKALSYIRNHLTEYK